MAEFRQSDPRYIIRKSVLLFADLLLLCISLYLYLSIFYHNSLWPSQPITLNLLWFGLLCGLWLVYSAALRLYLALFAPKISSLVRKSALVAALSSASFLLFPYLSPLFPDTRLAFYLFIGQTTLGISIWHFLFGKFFNKPALAKRTLIVGAGWSGKKIAKTLSNTSISEDLGYEVVGFIDDNAAKVGDEVEGFKVLSKSDEMFTYARRLKVDLIVLAVHTAENINGDLYSHIINCQNYGIELTPANILYEEVIGRVMVKQTETSLNLTYDFYSKPDDLLYLVLNRILNIGFSILGLFICGLAIPFVWYLNALFSRGPLFYSQIRTGRDGTPFRIYKFRTMVVNAEKGTGAVWANKNDSRITGPGNFYRKTRIDELPQFWNVLRGEMNLIGPRPERPEFVSELVKKIPFFDLRHEVKPGITGWAQVRHKYGNTEEDSLIKLQYDLYYIKNRSFLLDMGIIWRTIAVMIKFKGN